MKKLILFLLILINQHFCFSQIISDKIDNQMIVKNKVKSATYYSTQNSITFSASYDRSGRVVKFSQKPFMLGDKSEKIELYEYEDTLIRKLILLWMVGDIIVRNDTSYYEYDKSKRLEFITKKDNESKSEKLTQFIYLSSEHASSKNPNDKSFYQVMQKRNYGMVKGGTSIGNRIVIQKGEKRYMLDSYEIYHYSPFDYKPYSNYFYAYNNFMDDSTKATYDLLQYEKIYVWGDTLIQKIGYSSIPKFDSSVIKNSKIYNVPGNSFDGPFIDYMSLTRIKNGRPLHLASQNFGNIMIGTAKSGTDDYEYFPNGLIKKCIAFREGNNPVGKDTQFEEIYSYTYYKDEM